MKKAILLLLFSAFLCTHSFAQEKQNDLRIGYGVFTYDQIFDVFGYLLEDIVGFGSIEHRNEQWRGGFYASYKHKIGERISIGATALWDKSTSDVYGLGNFIGTSQQDFYTLAIEADFHYIQKDWFQLYSGLGAGFMYLDEKFQTESTAPSSSESSTNFTFQVNLLGIRIGNSFAFFAETGLGYKGVLNAGLSYEF